MLLESGVTVLYYQTTITLDWGKFYTFRIKARNEVGLSLDSDDLVILAARIPDKIVSLENNAAITTAYQAGLTWSNGAFDGGSPIIDYKVSYMLEPDGAWQIFSTTITD